MKIKLKLLFGFLPIIIMMIIIGVIGILANKNNSDWLSHNSAVDFPVNQTLHSLKYEVVQKMRSIEEYDGNWITEETMQGLIKEQDAQIQAELDFLSMNSHDLGSEGIKEIRVGLNVFNDLSIKLIGLHDADRAAKVSTMNEFDEKAEELEVMLGDLSEEYAKKVSTETVEVLLMGRYYMILNIIFIIVFILISLLIIRTVYKSTVKPIINLEQAASNILLGHYETRAKVQSNDEIGNLVRIFNSMAESIEKSQSAMFLKVDASAANLQKEVAKLEQTNKMMIGRELKMIELKKESEGLKKKLSKE